ncbi:MAG: hypothetical protein ACYTFZ_09870, partial [Planctomycetota bacterium]
MLGKQSRFGFLAWMLIAVLSAVLLGCGSRPDAAPVETALGVSAGGDSSAAPDAAPAETAPGVSGGGDSPAAPDAAPAETAPR